MHCCNKYLKMLTTSSYKFGRRAFSVAGTTAWNSLPDYLRDPLLSEDTFKRSLKTQFICLRCIRARSSHLHNVLYKFST